MWLPLRCLAIIPDFSFVLREVAKNGNQRINTYGTPIRRDTVIYVNSDLEDFWRAGHKLEYAREQGGGAEKSNRARHRKYDLTRIRRIFVFKGVNFYAYHGEEGG